MLYRIRFISEEVEDFLREIKIDSDATFLDLNRAILKSCGYTDDQMTSFYLCDDEWRRHEQVTREDMSDSTDKDVDLYVMEGTRLSELIEGEGQRMEYVFDPFSERVFSLEVVEEIPGQSLSNPKLSLKNGEPPRQIAELDLSDAALTAGVDTGEDFFGSDDFNADEIDAEGFEISDGKDY